MSMQVLRLVTVLYKVRMVVRDPMVLPKVSCDSLTSTFYGDMGKSVVIGAVQAHTEYVFWSSPLVLIIKLYSLPHK